MKDIYQVIKKVRISEKATMLQETTGELVLEVDRDANKIEIKKAVEVAFGKKVASVRTANYDGKLQASAPVLMQVAPLIGKKLTSSLPTVKPLTSFKAPY